MDGTTSLTRLGRAGGTTDTDLRACTRFVFCRPGWSVEEQATDQGGTCIRLRIERGGEGASGTWRVERADGGRLQVAREASGRAPRSVDTVREALVLIWEAEDSRTAAA
jgi:hypothetical protein